MRQTIFCNHYRAMSDHDTCSAGVEYASFTDLKYEARPCFARNGEPAPPGCPHAQFPTAEEIAEEDAEMTRRFQDTAVARAAIVSHLGGPWKPHHSRSEAGVIDCPVCDGNESLRFSRAGYNGHIHARCSTIGCVSWME